MHELALRPLVNTDVGIAAQMMARMTETYHDLGHDLGMAHMVPVLSRGLTMRINEGPAVVVGYGGGGANIVGVYQLPHFRRQGDQITSDNVGLFATNPEEQRADLHFLTALGAMFSDVAHRANVGSLVHRETTLQRSPSFEESGYALSRIVDDQRWARHVYERTFSREGLGLNPDEERVALEILRTLQ